MVATVEAEIQQSVPDYQLGADEFNELALAAWEAFYSACLQYHQVRRRGRGVIGSDRNLGGGGGRGPGGDMPDVSAAGGGQYGCSVRRGMSFVSLAC